MSVRKGRKKARGENISLPHQSAYVSWPAIFSLFHLTKRVPGCFLLSVHRALRLPSLAG
jgi:hypothetical protein